jgi:hypothetical protein
MAVNKWFGQLVSGLGTIASNVAGRDIRLGSGGSSLGANIAGQSKPYFSTNQNLAYAKGTAAANPYATRTPTYNVATNQIRNWGTGATTPAGGGGGDTSGSGSGAGGVSSTFVDPNTGMEYASYDEYANTVRNDINSGYNAYFAQLDSMLNNDLPSQNSAQLGIAQSQGTQAENTLGAQKTQGLADKQIRINLKHYRV